VIAPKRILILSADAGFGHRSAALAIAAALEETRGPACQVAIVNPLDDPRAPAVLRNGQATYDEIVRLLPDVQRVGYDAVGRLSAIGALERAATVLLFRAVYDLLKQRQPDVVVNTYPIYQAPLEAAFAILKRECPVVTVVTDLGSVSRAWFHDVADLCVVPTERVRALALEARLSAESVELIGIPVHPRVIKETRPPATLRAELGWHPGLITVLAVGSRRVARLGEAVEVLNHAGFPLQLAVVAGGDDELFSRLRKTDWHVPAQVYNFVEDIPTLMKAADILLTKAGGLIITEGLACGLPMLLIEYIPGQEVGNVEYVVENGAGAFAEPPLSLLRTVCHWLADDGQLLRQAALQARRLGRPTAAYEIADRVWALAQQGPVRLGRLERLARLLPGTAALLDRFNVKWRE
jgi:1,2-diacylglycerol 3-beta-galactosyltransferase